jgi:hypothetical protein
LVLQIFTQNKTAQATDNAISVVSGTAIVIPVMLVINARVVLQVPHQILQCLKKTLFQENLVVLRALLDIFNLKPIENFLVYHVHHIHGQVQVASSVLHVHQEGKQQE